jgi:hypothetical protein
VLLEVIVVDIGRLQMILSTVGDDVFDRIVSISRILEEFSIYKIAKRDDAYAARTELQCSMMHDHVRLRLTQDDESALALGIAQGLLAG